MAKTLLAQSMDEQLQELFGEGTPEEWMNQAIASAQQAEQRRAENGRLKMRLQAAEKRIEDLKTQTAVELIHIYPLATYVARCGRCQQRSLAGKGVSPRICRALYFQPYDSLSVPLQWMQSPLSPCRGRHCGTSLRHLQ